jgi:hypothetical protein
MAHLGGSGLDLAAVVFSLAKNGKRDIAQAFAKLEDGLGPERGGALSLIVAAMGDDAKAREELTRRANDAQAAAPMRVAALEGLHELGERETLKSTGLTLFDDLAKAQAWSEAHDVAHLLVGLAREGEDRAFAVQVSQRLDQVHSHEPHGH